MFGAAWSMGHVAQEAADSPFAAAVSSQGAPATRTVAERLQLLGGVLRAFSKFGYSPG